MYELKLQLPFNGFQIKGSLVLPVKAKDLVIFAHGWGYASASSHENIIAEKLQTQGFGTLLFDLLDEHEQLPEGYRNIELLSKGLGTSTQWLKGHSQYKNLRLAYIGSGTGAAVAFRVAGILQPLIDAVVSLSGRLDISPQDLSRVTCPSLLLVGELDFKTIDLNREALKHIRGKHQLAVIPGASHLFEEPGKTEDVAQIIASWLRKHLGQPSTSLVTE